MTSSLRTPRSSRSAASDSSDESGSPRLRSPRLRSSRGASAWPQAHIVTEWTAAARRFDATLNRRSLNTTMRRAVRETLAMAPRQQGALAKYFETSPSASSIAPSCEVGITISDDAEIAALNGQYRRKPRPTDVLSFAQNEGEAFPFDFPSDKMADGPPLALGDLVISIETTVRQAREQGHSLETEIAFLTVHGTLHLLGFDHVTDAGRRAMWKWQDDIMACYQTSQSSLTARPLKVPGEKRRDSIR